MSAKNRRISLEDYLDFFHSHPRIALPIHSLNLILRMHGFRKLSQVPKKVLAESLDELDLIDLSRSTIDNTDISSSVFITLEDVVADLNQLNWQECCVTSIQNLNSSEGHVASTVQATDLSLRENSQSRTGAADSCPQSAAVQSTATRKRKRSGGPDSDGGMTSTPSGLGSLGSR